MRKFPQFFALVVLAIATISGCASNPEETDSESQLPKIQGDKKISVQWRRSLGEGPGTLHTRLKAALDGDRIYVADTTGRLYALELATGKKIWSVNFDQPILGGVAYASGQVFVSLEEGSLVALSADEGEEDWRAILPSEAVAQASADEERVYVQTVDGRVTALERNNGAQAWSYESGLPVLTVRGTGAPLLIDRLVVTGFASGKVVALDKALGVPRWEQRLATPEGRSELERLVDVDGSPVFEGQLIYAAAYHGKLAAIVPTGEVIWEEEGSSYTSPELALGSVYLTLDDDSIQSYDMSTGEKSWRQDGLKGRILGQVTATGSSLAVADSEGYVHLISQVDGSFVGRIFLRPRPLHINLPHQGEATNWRLVRGRDFGIRSTLVNTSEGLIVYTNDGELLLLSVD